MRSPKQQRMALGIPVLVNEPIGGKSGVDRWYYLYKPRSDEMLVLDDGGRDAWVAHDTIRNTPHLFSPRSACHKRQSYHKGSVIKKYKWQVKE